VGRVLDALLAVRALLLREVDHPTTSVCL
jgi:hypothetical protein